MGFQASKVDVSLFIFNQDGLQIYILIYVDDIIIVSSSSSATDKLLQQLCREFAMKNLGRLNYFLGIEVHHTSLRLILMQRKYICDLLLRTNMDTSKGVSTPMLPADKLSLHDGVPLSPEDTTKNKSVVGTLVFVSYSARHFFLSESGLPVSLHAYYISLGCYEVDSMVSPHLY
jgi:hypothetical protein